MSSDACGWREVVVRLYGEWSRERWEEMSAFFSEAKEEARRVDAAVVAMVIDGQAVYAQPRGGQRDGVHARWIVEQAGIGLAVRGSRVWSESTPSVVVSLGEEALRGEGVIVAWACVHQLLTRLGFRVRRELVSRVMWCAEIEGVDSAELVSAMVAGRSIARGRNWRADGTSSPLIFGCFMRWV